MDDHRLSDTPNRRSLTILIGEDKYESLARDFGGRMFYIPEAVGEHHPLSVSVGLDAAQKICQAYGCLYMDIAPSSTRIRILDLYKRGVNPNIIGTKAFCSRRYVYKVLQEAKDDSQLDLF